MGWNIDTERFFVISRTEVFRKKGVLKNFTKFTVKHLDTGNKALFFNKILLKRRLWHRCFSVKVMKFLWTPFNIEHFGGCFWISWRQFLNTSVKGWPWKRTDLIILRKLIEAVAKRCFVKKVFLEILQNS